MPTQSISLKLMKNGESEPEMLYVNRANGKWKSPGEGWLGPQAGIWNEFPGGLHLMDPHGKEEMALCKGLVFDTCFTLEHGTATYQFSGGDGLWQVLGVF